MATTGTKSQVGNPAVHSSSHVPRSQNLEKQPVDDFITYWKEYAKERPEVCALWCFGIGFVLGWKLKPW